MRKEEAKQESKLMETVILEQTIIKLGGLCALGEGRREFNIMKIQ
jgi:hypothetical protein